MVRLKPYIVLLGLLFGTFSISAQAQDLAFQEKQLLAIYQDAASCSALCRLAKMDSFEKQLLSLLKQPESWEYPFTKLTEFSPPKGKVGTIDIVYSPDSNFRLFTYLHHKGWDAPANAKAYQTFYQIKGAIASGIVKGYASDEAFFWGTDRAREVVRMDIDKPMYLLASTGNNGYKLHQGEGAYATTYLLSFKCLQLTDDTLESYVSGFPKSIETNTRAYGAVMSVVRDWRQTNTYDISENGLQITVTDYASSKKEKVQKITKWIWKGDHFEKQKP